MTMMTSGAEPCSECGTAGGRIPSGQSRPGRKQGMCYQCYDRISNHGDISVVTGLGSRNTYAHPFFPEPNNIPALNYYLWHDINGQHQSHGVMPYGHSLGSKALDALYEGYADGWLRLHPNAPLLEWPDPSLALFGAANATAEAA